MPRKPGRPAYTPTEITFAIATDTQKIWFGTTEPTAKETTCQ
jgi:hypothetical protein